MTEHATAPKPLKEITKRLKEDAEYDLDAWIKGDYIVKNVVPADTLAVLAQLDIVSELVSDTHLPMRLLFRLATTMSVSIDTDKAVIGGVLLQCHRELEDLTKFCTDLDSMKVKYPCRDVEEGEE